MEPDDFNTDETLIEETVTSDNLSWINISPTESSIVNISFELDDSVYTDISYGVAPEENNPEIYTSHEQREQHDKYPALKKAWDDYLAMYNLSRGEPPYVD